MGDRSPSWTPSRGNRFGESVGRSNFSPPFGRKWLVLSADARLPVDPYAEVVVAMPSSFLHESRPADAPPVDRLDRILAYGFAVVVLVEGVVRPDVAWRVFVTVAALALSPALLLRRRSPLVSVAIGFGVAGVLSILQLATRSDELGLYSMMVVPVLLYSLVRWGSGREVVVGTAFVTVVVATGMYASATGWADVFGGIVFLLLFVCLGAVFRFRSALWQRQELEIRSEERVALARELHDIVAHHVSAIAVQAQAGGAVAATQPDKAHQVFSAIESEASSALAEMRTMVRVLREGEGADFSPQPGVADLAALARPDATPAIAVSLASSVAQLPPPVDAAIYRLAQEALTNAVRHGTDATAVEIVVFSDRNTVRLSVADDGRAAHGAASRPGFGLIGMEERAKLLGGTLSAGPGPEGGWLVEAVLPLDAPT